MSPVEIGIIGIIVLFIFIFLGMPVGAAMGLVGVLGLAALTNFDAGLAKLGQTAFTKTASYIIAVIPLFILMGEFAFVSGLTPEAYATMNIWLGRLPGGLAIATIGACASFSAVCGSSAATASTMGAVALPEMRKYKYDDGFALATIAAGGTLGILIPPSTAFVLYGLITEQSIGKLFLAGVFPGILLSLIFMIMIFIWATVKPETGPRGKRTTWLEKLVSLKGLWAVVLLFVVVIGGIYAGIFTATEAAGVGTFCAFALAASRRRMTGQKLKAAFEETFRTTGLIFVMIIGASLFGYFLATSNISRALADYISSLQLSPLSIIIVILVIYLLLGCLMDAFSMLLIMTPILFPLVLKLGFDPIWFGVVSVIMVEMGLITPPIGLNVFIMAGVARDVPIFAIFRAIAPFVIAIAACVAVLIAFPQIALFLPFMMK